ncbi:MAG TPA: phosphatidate cytidylyltransferase [Balneolaceae bacterium]|nr:phosphatidate cytidylyltransferase [Balneolaceae bacterium]
MTELTRRTLFAIPAAVLFLWVTWLGGVYFEAMIGLIALLVIWETSRMLDKAGMPVILPLSLGIAVYIWFLTALPWMVTLAITTILLLAGLVSVTGRRTEVKQRYLSSLFAGVYAVFGFMMIVQIRELGSGQDGFWLAISLFLMIWGNDVFAYFGGRAFGKRKLAPVLSPNKTWEGFYSGIAGAAIGFLIAWISADLFPLPLWVVIPASLLVSVLGPLGDITESGLKRMVGVKDSSNLIPGHGGFFDRFDSMILAAPFIYFLYYFLIV